MTEDLKSQLDYFKDEPKYLRKVIDELEQENKELSFAIEKCLENAGIECDDEEQALRSLPDLGASHYKVLQENKELKKQRESDKGLITVGGKQQYEYLQKIDKLKQENKELKIYIESNKQQIEEVEMLVMDNDRLQQEVENLKDIIYYDVEKYRIALEEIREIVKPYLTDCQGSLCEPIDEVLNKINEVLNLS